MQESLIFVQRGRTSYAFRGNGMWLFSVCLQCCASDRVCPFSFLFEPGNILGIADSIETITEFLEIEKWETISKTGRDIALQSLQTEESVIAAWEKIVLQT